LILQDSQAAHVIEKILNDFVDEEIVFIYEDILENFMLLANHMKGLCVVKKAIQQVKFPDLFNKFEKIITDNALALVHNPYGNYAIQTAFEVNHFINLKQMENYNIFLINL